MPNRQNTPNATCRHHTACVAGGKGRHRSWPARCNRAGERGPPRRPDPRGRALRVGRADAIEKRGRRHPRPSDRAGDRGPPPPPPSRSPGSGSRVGRAGPTRSRRDGRVAFAPSGRSAPRPPTSRSPAVEQPRPRRSRSAGWRTCRLRPVVGPVCAGQPAVRTLGGQAPPRGERSFGPTGVREAGGTGARAWRPAPRRRPAPLRRPRRGGAGLIPDRFLGNRGARRGARAPAPDMPVGPHRAGRAGRIAEDPAPNWRRRAWLSMSRAFGEPGRG